MSLLSVFTSLASNKGDRVLIEVVNTGSGYEAIITPDLGEVPSNADEREVAIRSALATPLIVTGSPSVIETSISDRVREFSSVRRSGLSSLDVLRNNLEQAHKVGSNKATDSVKASSTEKPAPADVQSQDSGLGDDAQSSVFNGNNNDELF